MNKQKREVKFLKKLVPVMACLAVAATIVVYPMINNRNVAVDPNPNPSVIVNPKNAILTNLEDGKHSDIVELTNGRLEFNSSDSGLGARLKLDLDDKNQKQLSLSEVFSYLGYELNLENLPSDLVSMNDHKYAIYYNEDGSVAYDNFSFIYEAESNKVYDPLLRNLLVEVSKENNTTDLFYLLPEDEKKSTINGVDVIVGFREMDYGPYDDNHNPAGYYDMYVAKFKYKGLYFRVVTDNLTQEEFVNILTSIIKDNNQTSISAIEDTLIINDSEGKISSAKLYFDPKTTHSIQMNQEEYIEHLGKDPRPSYIPEGCVADGNKYYSIIKNNDGTTAYDNGGFRYRTEDNSSNIYIITSKDKLPTRDCLYLTDSEKTSTINGIKVYLSYSKEIYSINKIDNKHGMHFATFIYDGVGYDIEFTNVPQEEVIKVIKSIVQPIS